MKLLATEMLVLKEMCTLCRDLVFFFTVRITVKEIIYVIKPKTGGFVPSYFSFFLKKIYVALKLSNHFFSPPGKLNPLVKPLSTC